MADQTKLSNQSKVDTGQEISPDGNIITQAAAPLANRVSPFRTSSNADESIMEKLPKADEGQTQTTTEPTKSDETTPAEKIIDFTDFLKTKGEEVEASKPATTEPAKSTTTQLQVNPSTTPQAQSTQQTQQSQARDYTGFDDEESKLLRSMSNESFNRFKPLLLEHKKMKLDYDQAKTAQTELTELKTKGPKIPDNIYEHEQGFLLTPDFHIQNNTVSLAQAILQHWQSEFAKVNNGAAEYNTLKLDDKGNLVLADKVKAGPEAIGNLMGLVNGAQMQLAQENSKLQNLVGNHKTKFQESQGWLNHFNTTNFSMFEEPQFKEQAKPYIQQVVDGFHPSMQRNPLANSLAKALIIIRFLQQQNAKLAPATQVQTTNGQAATVQNTNRQQIQQEQQRRAGPTSANVGGETVDNGNTNGKEVSYDDFEKVKNGDY